MGAARPAAWASHPILELLDGAADATLTSRIALGIFDPADGLVARQGGDVAPRVGRHLASTKALLEIGGKVVDRATTQLARCHLAIVEPPCPTASHR